MKPLLEELLAACPEIEEAFVRMHWERLDERYFARFPLERIRQHIRGLARLSPEHPVEILIEKLAHQNIACTLLAFDYPFEFSLITGVMAALGFNILSGGIHTYARLPENPTGKIRPRFRNLSQPQTPNLLQRRRIVDHFIGQVESGLSPDQWSEEFKQKIFEVLRLLEQPGERVRAQAQQKVNEMVAQRLATLPPEAQVLYPMQIEIDNASGPFTRLKVLSEDTRFFLYSFSHALSLQNISIEHVRINTVHQRIEDTLDFVDLQGKKIEDPEALNRIKLSVLLTKQFTLFLGKAPDPYTALSRFENLVEDILRLPRRGQWLQLLSNPRILKDLARLLGASDFLWEDVIRQQYETLLPMLSPHIEGRRFAHPLETLPERLEQWLAGTDDYEEKRKRLNEFKDQEIFLVDLDHILTPGANFHTLAEHLTYLAETVVKQAIKINTAELSRQFGTPRTIAGWEVRWAVLGLGKFGGAALGYASDIELLFVYSDSGKTDGATPMDNREFFEQLAKRTTSFIQAKREGIFNIDLRLRPYGEDGPLACSLESFCHFYGPGGSAHAMERLALVRLRYVGGEQELGHQLERLRDEFIYATPSIDFKALRELRIKQFEEKTRPGQKNVKFSPGGLADLEYDVQILQVMYGKDHVKLRTPRIHQALMVLQEVGVINQEESADLIQAYGFLRELINGLRMLRGSAQDLFLPQPGSDEYLHLARRLGYETQPGLDPAQQLHIEFETRTAAVRAFVDRHFGREALPGPKSGNVADLILSDQPSAELRQAILQQAGFREPERAYINLRNLSALAGAVDRFARLAILACDVLKQQPDPDMALNNWERFVSALPEPAQHFEQLHSQPRQLEILMTIFASSQFLADSLIHWPALFNRMTDPEKLRRVCERQEQEAELRRWQLACQNEAEWMNRLRLYRRQEFLRIGARDICLHVPLPEITLELSNLAEAFIQVVLDQVWQQLKAAGKYPLPSWEHPEQHFCILALGKLGGQELNYSSDIDLVGICDDRAIELRTWLAEDQGADLYTLVLENLRTVLSQYTEQGYVYRTDFRLRPYGLEGTLVTTLSQMEAYYEKTAALSEIQALLKMRPIAGNLQLGEVFKQTARAILLRQREPGDIVNAIEKIRNYAILQHSRAAAAHTDVKSGIGGLRDIEFLVQGLQLIHAPQHPELLTGNTLAGLRALFLGGYLDARLVSQLEEDYIFLRRVEHYLQILEDQQIHALPAQPTELLSLAKRMLGQEAGTEMFLEDLNLRLKRVREAYRSQLVEKYAFHKS